MAHLWMPSNLTAQLVNGTQLGLFQAPLQRPILARELFGIDEDAEPLIETERCRGGIALLREIGIGHRGQAEVMQAFNGLFTQQAGAPVGNRPARGHSRDRGAAVTIRWCRVAGDRGRVLSIASTWR